MVKKSLLYMLQQSLGNFISEKYKNFAFDVYSIDKLLLHVSTFDKPPLDADTEWWRYTLVENAFDQLIEKILNMII